MTEIKPIVVPEGKIYDYIDSKFRNDTPEEYVRQTVEKRLINEHGYPKERVKVEHLIKVGAASKRADLAIFREGSETYPQENIEIIIECKNEKVKPENKKEGVEQLKVYMSSCPNCEWGMWTNGKFKAVFRKVLDEKKRIRFDDFNDIPSANGSLEEIDRPTREGLKRAVEDNLLFVFRTCHDYIYVHDGMQKQPAFFEFLKVIFCKTLDEKSIPEPLEFYATSGEKNNSDGQLTVYNRISKIFDKVKKKYKTIFAENEKINLERRSLAYIVAQLQKYTLIDTNIDIKGKAYEELVGSNLRGDRGEFFTPRNVARMAVEMIAPKINERVLDPACGTGGFLVLAMNKVIRDLENEMERKTGKTRNKWSDSEKKNIQDRVKEIAENQFFGIDINPDLVKATKMNMVMNNDGSGNINRENSLLPPHEWSPELKKSFAKSLDINPNILTNNDSLALFDVVITNPPFGSRIPINEPQILEQFELAYIWEKSEGGYRKTNRMQSSVPPEQLFIERCLHFLKPGKRLAIVLPDSILGAPGLEYIRYWIMRNTFVVSSVDLHVDTFQPHNGTQTSILILQKKTEEEKAKEEKTRQMKPYNIFMVMVDRVGHDKRDNPIFKRDKYGNEILVPEETNVYEMGYITDGTPTVKSESMVRVRDDQTKIIPGIFAGWKKEEGISW